MLVEILYCHNPLFCRLDHSVALNFYSSDKEGSCISAANILHTSPRIGIKTKR
jgi:hypothetical protein